MLGAGAAQRCSHHWQQPAFANRRDDFPHIRWRQFVPPQHRRWIGILDARLLISRELRRGVHQSVGGKHLQLHRIHAARGRQLNHDEPGFRLYDRRTGPLPGGRRRRRRIGVQRRRSRERRLRRIRSRHVVELLLRRRGLDSQRPNSRVRRRGRFDRHRDAGRERQHDAPDRGDLGEDNRGHDRRHR